MFRQVVSHRWSPGLGDGPKDAFRAALSGMREIPDLVALHAGDDAGHFAGNFDYVAVMDFADFAAARRYVEHPLHQHFIEHHARTCLAERVVVQHDWGTGSAVGFHHVKIPVSDAPRSRDWYCQVLGFAQEIEFVEDGVLAGVALRHPQTGLRLALRADPGRCRAMAGFDLVALAVSTLEDLRAIAAQAAAAGVEHGPIIQGHIGWACDIPDPDGILVRLYTYERPA
jgi:catechol 2,3-dioxygenase-like lactoylglutathione lyase family enzyme